MDKQLAHRMCFGRSKLNQWLSSSGPATTTALSQAWGRPTHSAREGNRRQLIKAPTLTPSHVWQRLRRFWNCSNKFRMGGSGIAPASFTLVVLELLQQGFTLVVLELLQQGFTLVVLELLQNFHINCRP